MKKLITAFIFILFTIPVFTTDIRQVMFGNNYETIKEISEKEINEYAEELKAFKTYTQGHYEHRNKEHKYFRFFEQSIGDKKFIRVIKSVNELTDEYILKWRNPGGNTNHPYLTQLFYVKNPNEICAVGTMCMMDAGGDGWENGTDNKYQMIEIIQRNNTVKGFLVNYLEDRIDHHNRAEESGIHTEKYINTAEYYLFDDIINNAVEVDGKIKYIKDYDKIPFVKISTDQPLIDSKRPFMYTIQNAFDGNPATAYVENTDDDLFEIEFKFEITSNFLTIDKIKIINGYAKSNDLYFNNNRIKKFSFSSFDMNSHGEDEEEVWNRLWEKYKDTVLPDSLKLYEVQLIPVDLYLITFSVDEIQRGNKYSDTCIAELDFNVVNGGWLFGE